MREIFGKAGSKTFILILLFLSLSLIGLEKARAENIRLRLIAVNPSKTKTQTIEIKKYLPEEIQPKDIVDLGNLALEYDTAKSSYYVYKKSLTLNPAEIRTFEIEVKDIWVIPEYKLSDVKERTDSILSRLENKREYYDKAKEIADSVYERLNEIRTSQATEAISRQQHIGIYRQNLAVLAEVKEDVARMEKILVTAGGPPAPEMLADTKIKADSPSKTMTWIVIFSIVVFMGLLAGVLFFTWYRQSRLAKEEILGAKKEAFPKPEAKEEKPKESKESKGN